MIKTKYLTLKGQETKSKVNNSSNPSFSPEESPDNDILAIFEANSL